MEARTNRGPDCWINQMCWFSPKHFLTQFMPEYAGQAKIDAMMKEMASRVNDWSEHVRPARNRPAPARGVSGTVRLPVNPQPLLLGLRPGREPASVPGRRSAVPDGEPDVFRWFAGEHDIPATAVAILSRCLPTSRTWRAGDYSVYRWPAMAGTTRVAATWNEDPFIGQMMRTKDFR